MKRFLTVLFFVALVLGINGCARVPRHLVSTGYVAPAPMIGGLYHEVSRGETLYRISKLYGVDVSELMRVNHIQSPSQLAAGQRLFIPQYVLPSVTAPGAYEAVSIDQVRQLVGPKDPSSRWETITVHHSGTATGSARLFDRDHRRRHMGGLFYHFVIGNGTRTPDGMIEVGWRWRKQVDANRPYDIQICLVGNFDKEQVSERQMDALAKLIVVLQEEYGIPMGGIRRHKDVPGKRTDCPGANFPFSRLLSKVTEQSHYASR